MQRARFRKAELALAKRSQHLAEFQRQSVAAERLCETITNYIEWRAFAYWARLIVETEGHIQPVMKAALEARCPGFLALPSRRREAPAALWLRLISWIDEHIFGYAKAEGWSHALGYYAVRDPRYDQVESYWRHCAQTWKCSRPGALPTFEEWRNAAADFAQHP